MKQETLEEAAENYQNIYQIRPSQFAQDDFIAGAKWQQERSYSEVDVLVNLLKQTTEYEVLQSFRDKVEQFKKK